MEPSKALQRESSILSTDSNESWFSANRRLSEDSMLSDNMPNMGCRTRFIGADEDGGEDSSTEGFGQGSDETVQHSGVGVGRHGTLKAKDRISNDENSSVSGQNTFKPRGEVGLKSSRHPSSLAPSSPTPSQQTFSSHSSSTPTAPRFPHMVDGRDSRESISTVDFSDLDRRLIEDEESSRQLDIEEEERSRKKQSFLGPRMRMVSPAPWDRDDGEVEVVRKNRDNSRSPAPKKSFELSALMEKERARKFQAAQSSVSKANSNTSQLHPPTRQLPHAPPQISAESSFLDMSDAMENRRSVSPHKLKKSPSSLSLSSTREHKRSFTSASTKSFSSVSSEASNDRPPKMPRPNSRHMYSQGNDSTSSVPSISTDDHSTTSYDWRKVKRKSSASTLAGFIMGGKSKSSSPRRRSSTMISAPLPFHEDVPPLPDASLSARQRSTPDLSSDKKNQTVSARSTTFEIVSPECSPPERSTRRNIRQLHLDVTSNGTEHRNTSFLDQPPPSPLYSINAGPTSAPADIMAFKNLTPLRTKDLPKSKDLHSVPSPSSVRKRTIAKDSIQPPTPGTSATFDAKDKEKMMGPRLDMLDGLGLKDLSSFDIGPMTETSTKAGEGGYKLISLSEAQERERLKHGGSKGISDSYPSNEDMHQVSLSTSKTIKHRKSGFLGKLLGKDKDVPFLPSSPVPLPPMPLPIDITGSPSSSLREEKHPGSSKISSSPNPRTPSRNQLMAPPQGPIRQRSADQLPFPSSLDNQTLRPSVDKVRQRNVSSSSLLSPMRPGIGKGPPSLDLRPISMAFSANFDFLSEKPNDDETPSSATTPTGNSGISTGTIGKLNSPIDSSSSVKTSSSSSISSGKSVSTTPTPISPYFRKDSTTSQGSKEGFKETRILELEVIIRTLRAELDAIKTSRGLDEKGTCPYCGCKGVCRDTTASVLERPRVKCQGYGAGVFSAASGY